MRTVGDRLHPPFLDAKIKPEQTTRERDRPPDARSISYGGDPIRFPPACHHYPLRQMDLLVDWDHPAAQGRG